MNLHLIRLSNFQSFGPDPVSFTVPKLCYLIGPNGSGKTAALQAICRLFAFDPALRRIKKSDFHVPRDETEVPAERKLWIEVDFVFPELEDGEESDGVAPNFGHMRLDEADGLVRVRFRLEATLSDAGDIDESLVYVLDVKEDGTIVSTAQVPKAERNEIHVHYLPARRDPADHIAYGANALLGRMLRAVNWDNERAGIRELTDEITERLSSNPSISAFSDCLSDTWTSLHKGSYFADPKITFAASEVEALLRHLSISFSPAHDDRVADFSRLSDGQKSMLYLSLVVSSHAIGRKVLTGEDISFDVEKLLPPIFTIIAIEEPENSLSPHFLGRIVNTLSKITSNGDAQALIATHAPSMLRRVPPENIRYLRLNAARTTQVRSIRLPETQHEAHKFVREAVQAFPEIYFSRLVVLGEGDSEEIVLPKLLRAKGAPIDESGVTVAPLGGRHVNHFWRLLSELQIPYLTLLDLDLARFGGGWGRIKYVNDQLGKHQPDKQLPTDHGIPDWNSDSDKVMHYSNYFELLEKSDVFFSSPMDLDFALLAAFPVQYGATREDPDAETIKAVLGKSHYNAQQYAKEQMQLFGSYHRLFKINSKPAAHIQALAHITDAQILAAMPPSLARLADGVIARLAELPE